MVGSCRKSATRRVPRERLQGDLAVDRYRKPQPGQTRIGLSKD